MKKINFITILIIILLISIDSSNADNGYGINCYHNTELYAIMPPGSSGYCPAPSENSHMNVPFHKHLDANDPDCIITQSPGNGF